MKNGDLIKYAENIYEVSEVKSNSKGIWARFSKNPKSSDAIACTGIMSECWFISSSLELIDGSGCEGR